jgi:P27 family predicted phage terminase small subunit
LTAGRKPKPTHLKLIEGNAGKRPINRKEPKPKRSRPPAPSHLDPATRKLWDAVVKELDDIAILTSVDIFAVEVLCEALADHRSAVATIARNARAYAASKKSKQEPAYSIDGRYYRTTNQAGSDMWRQHPALALKSDADKRIRGWCAEFGLTPASRTRLTVGTGGGSSETNEDDDEFDLGG